jgi:hypothetical protein
MKIQLSPPEIARAIQHYIANKMGVSPDSLSVRIAWRGMYAEVDAGKPLPTLHDSIEGHHG